MAGAGLAEELDETLYRRWRYSLLSRTGAFRAHDIQRWQIVLSKKSVLGAYVYRY